MILTKKVPYQKRQIILHASDFDNFTWNMLSELFDFPYESISIDLTVEGSTCAPRVFQPEECDFIPVDERSILGKVD